MTFKNVLRGLSLGALLAVPVAAQNGENYHVMSNGLDVVYGGLGAGGAQVAGVDGVGFWVDGEEMVGNTITFLGDYGYKQAGFALSECVLGAPPAVAISFPLITVIEFDGRNAYQPDVFLHPSCTVGGAPVGITTGGFLPYGFAPATSFNFLFTGLPSGVGVPSTTTQLIPENGLLNNSATATIIAAAGAALPIASTGFCWVVDFTWNPSALVSLDRVDGWWYWLTNSENGNQYWGWSNDEQNLFQSQSIMTDAGQTGLFAFFGNLDYEWHSKTTTPSNNLATAPTGANGAGTYYTTAAAPACSTVASTIFNGGFNLGRASGVSISGAGGTVNPVTGVSNQDPAGAALPIPAGQSAGFVSWDNAVHFLLNSPGNLGGTAASWLQVADSHVLDPLLGSPGPGVLDLNVPQGPQAQRVPGGLESIVAGWPQATTIDNLLTWGMDRCSAAGNPAWPDPWAFPGGAFGIAPVVGSSSIHAPLGAVSPVCSVGLPLVIEMGLTPTVNSTFFAKGFADFTWDEAVGVVSTTTKVHLID